MFRETHEFDTRLESGVIYALPRSFRSFAAVVVEKPAMIRGLKSQISSVLVVVLCFLVGNSESTSTVMGCLLSVMIWDRTK